MLSYYLQNSTLRVASKIWVDINVWLFEFYWSGSINNGGKNVNVTQSDLRNIIFERALPENLYKGQVSIIDGVLQDIFSIIEDSNRLERPRSPSNICGCSNLLCGRDASNFVKKLCNFLKDKSRFIKNNPLCVNELVLGLINHNPLIVNCLLLM